MPETLLVELHSEARTRARGRFVPGGVLGFGGARVRELGLALGPQEGPRSLEVGIPKRCRLEGSWCVRSWFPSRLQLAHKQACFQSPPCSATERGFFVAIPIKDVFCVSICLCSDSIGSRSVALPHVFGV